MTSQNKRKFLATTLTATMVAAAVAPVAGVAAAEKVSFPDVPADHNYAGVIAAMAKAGIVKGDTDGKFNMGGTITRAEAAQMVAGLRDLKTGEEANKTKFKDVKGDVWYTGAINSLVSEGIIVGKTETTFEPNANITRGELAQLLVVAYGLEDVKVDDVELPFTDVADEWFAKPIKILYSEGLIKGLNATTFGPKDNMKRGDFTWLAANVDYVHGSKLEKPEAPETGELNVKSVSAITATEVTVAIDAPEKDLVDQTVVVKDAAGKVIPTKAATIKAGATEATFAFATPLTVSPTSQWTVNGVAYKVAEFGIVAVETADSNNKNIVVEFNSPIKSLDASEIVIREKVAQTRAGIASVTLAKDGMSASVQLIGFGDASVAGLKSQTVYTFSITQNGKVTTADFEIPAVLENAVVHTIKPSTRTIEVAVKNNAGDYVNSRIVNVPQSVAFDFNEALGRDLTVWTDKNNAMTKFAYNDETVIYDAIEYETKTINGVATTVVKTVTDGKTYEIATGNKVGVQSTNTGALDTTIGNKDNYAKIVLGTDGKTKSIIAHDLNNTILVDKVENETVSGYGLAASLKDYTILKDGKTATIADVKTGDAVYYNTTTKVAEIYNNTVSGKISAFYDGEIQLEGKSYAIANAQGVINDKFTALNNNNVAAYTNVTAHLNRAGELKLLTGERSEAASATSVAFGTEKISTFNYKGVDFLKVATQKADGTKVVEEVDPTKLKSVKGIAVGSNTTFQTGSLTQAQTNAGNVLKVSGFFIAKIGGTGDDKLFYAHDGSTVNAAKNDVVTNGAGATLATEITIPNVVENIVEVTKADKDVTGLNFLGNGANVTTAAELTDKALVTAGGALQLSAGVPVFLIDKLAQGQTTQTYTSTTWGALDSNISKINENGNNGNGEFTVYSDGNGNAKYIVLNEKLIEGAKANKEFEGVISEVKYGTQATPEVAYIKFAGDDTEYKFSSPVTASLVIGQVLNVESKDATIIGYTTEVVGSGITNDTSVTGVYSATNAQIADGEFSIGGTAGYELANSFTKVYEVTGTGVNEKLVERTYADLANLKADQFIEASLIAANSKKVDAIVIRTAATQTATINIPAVDGTVGVAYTGAAATVTGVTGATNFTYTPATALPTGLSINTSTGAITGTPTVAVVTATDYTIDVTYDDVLGVTQTKTVTVSVKVAKGAAPAAPTGLTPSAATSSGAQDGKIGGLTAGTAYEITNDAGATWTTATLTGTEITGLAAGTYKVRLAETPTHEAGQASADVVVTD